MYPNVAVVALANKLARISWAVLRHGQHFAAKEAPKLKNTLRKMARRTVDALWDGIGIALDDFPPQECLNYFGNAGYGST